MYRASHVFYLIVTIIWLCGRSAATAYAAIDPPPWRQHLICDRADQRYRGLEYCTAEEGRVHVIVVDLHNPGIRLEYVIAAGVDKNGRFGECKDVNVPAWGPVRGGCADPQNPALYPVMSLDEAVRRRPDAAVVINSDYFGRETREHGPEGFTVVRGDRLDGPANGDKDNNAVRRPWLAVSRDAPLRAELGQWTSDDGSKPDWIYTGIGGGPWLIRDGIIQREDIRTCKNTPGSCYDGALQTAVGLSQDRRWLFLVVDGRKGKLMDLAQFMREQLAAWDAIKFDGGGSSQLWYGGRVIEIGDGRQLSQYLAVIAEPGAGIQDAVAAAGLSAQPLSPLFFDVILPGETAHLRIEVRNAGATTWRPGQGIELRRVWKDVVSPIVESYPLSHAVAPDETATWDITLNVGASRFTYLYFQMYQAGVPFGPEITALVITLPEPLREQEERLRQTIQRQIEEWKKLAERELEERRQELEKQLAEWLQRELERQARNLVEQLCGGNALAPVGLAIWLTTRRRR